MNILIVDDEPDYRLVLGRMLSQHGHKVILAEHGRDALQKMKHTPIDLIITDVYMPVMDGFALYSAVRGMKEHGTLPILFVSAYVEDPRYPTVRNPKIDGFHKKEKPVEELLGWIKYLTGAADHPPTGPAPKPAPSGDSTSQKPSGSRRTAK
jgi:CheY-like chemotaxis protein